MAYEIKYELFFTDVENNKFKIEILQKDFVLDRFNTGVQPTKLIGTATPAVIEWDAEDDIYSPIIGSRCILNFFVTDSNTYDDFYQAGEREYKVKILEYASFGNNWEDEALEYDVIDQNYEGRLGSEVFYVPIWEGFIVNDGYQEAIVSTPFEIKLEAIDGLGTLDSFDVPFPSDNTTAKEKMFFYLKEILKLTGHEFNLYISNDIRKSGGATNDTIFHDIEVDRYIFSNKNLTLMNAKEALKHLLKMTNSRVFQSFARWYIINNSSIVDNRVDQGTYGASGADVVNEPAEPTPPALPAPDVFIDGVTTMYYNVTTSYRLLARLNQGTVIKWTWNLPDGSTLVQSDPDNQFFGIYSLGQVSQSQNGDSYTVTGEDSLGRTDTSAAFVLNIQEQTTDPTKEQTGEANTGDDDANDTVPIATNPTGYTLTVIPTGKVIGANVSPTIGTLSYSASEAGSSFTMTFNVISSSGEFTAASNITTSLGLGIPNGSVSHALSGDIIVITVTGNKPFSNQAVTLSLSGSANVQQFRHRYSPTYNVLNLTNASFSTANIDITGGEGFTYSRNFNINASSGYKWQSAGNVTVTASPVIHNRLTVSKLNNTTLRVTMSGTIGVSDETSTITVTGGAVGSDPASTISLSPSPTYEIAQNAGYFYMRVTSNGNYRINADRSWLSFSPSTGVTGTTNVKVQWSANTRANTRNNTINFFPTGSNTVIHTASVEQEGTA